jgi:hypothetical protein
MGLGRESVYESVDRSAGVLEIVSGALFSGAVALPIAVEDFVKVCHVRGPLAGSIRRAYVDWRGKHTCRVGRVFSPAGSTSIRITVTLGYE